MVEVLDVGVFEAHVLRLLGVCVGGGSKSQYNEMVYKRDGLVTGDWRTRRIWNMAGSLLVQYLKRIISISSSDFIEYSYRIDGWNGAGINDVGIHVQTSVLYTLNLQSRHH